MKILIIQQKRIGDVLTSSILANSLKKEYPNATIDYMCYANSVDVLKENNISQEQFRLMRIKFMSDFAN